MPGSGGFPTGAVGGCPQRQSPWTCGLGWAGGCGVWDFSRSFLQHALLTIIPPLSVHRACGGCCRLLLRQPTCCCAALGASSPMASGTLVPQHTPLSSPCSGLERGRWGCRLPGPSGPSPATWAHLLSLSGPHSPGPTWELGPAHRHLKTRQPQPGGALA